MDRQGRGLLGSIPIRMLLAVTSAAGGVSALAIMAQPIGLSLARFISIDCEQPVLGENRVVPKVQRSYSVSDFAYLLTNTILEVYP